MADGKLYEYEELSFPLFVSGYVKIMDSQKPDVRAQMSSHIAELMADAELYGSSRWSKAGPPGKIGISS